MCTAHIIPINEDGIQILKFWIKNLLMYYVEMLFEAAIYYMFTIQQQ